MISEYLHIITDPAHGFAELTYSIIIDLLVIGLIWAKLVKPRFKREVHEEIDNSHGYSHNERNSHEEVSIVHRHRSGPISPTVRVFYLDSDSGSDSDADNDRHSDTIGVS